MRTRGEQKMKMNIPMCLALILLCLTIITTHMMSGLYAKYIVRDSGADSARVASFNVTEDNFVAGGEIALAIEPGIYEKTVQVINKSEVAIHYTITVENLTDNIPFKFSIGPKATSPVTEGEQSESFDMPPDSAENIEFRIIWEQEGAQNYMKRVDKLKISIEAVQID